MCTAKKIEVNKTISRSQLDEQLTKLPKKKASVDLGKYAGKINFKIDGLEYQLKMREEWK